MPTSRELLAHVLQRLASESRPTPAPDLVTTGYPSLDRLLAGGLRRGELTVIGGDAGAGKTALALGIAIRAAVAGHPVLILTHESSEEQCWERLVTAESGVTHIAMRTGILPAGAADSEPREPQSDQDDRGAGRPVHDEIGIRGNSASRDIAAQCRQPPFATGVTPCTSGPRRSLR